jgi:protein-tyrosine-phosphatase
MNKQGHRWFQFLIKIGVRNKKNLSLFLSSFGEGSLPKIVFVCTRNRFRSPLAAAMLQNELSFHEFPGEWIVESAGSWVHDLVPPTPEAFIEAEKRELDISSHISQGIEAFDLDSIDLLLVMELGQKESILLDFPKLSNRTYLLSELSGPPFSIPDPYVSKEPFDEIALEIESLIKSNIDKITALADKSIRS